MGLTRRLGVRTKLRGGRKKAIFNFRGFFFLFFLFGAAPLFASPLPLLKFPSTLTPSPTRTPLFYPQNIKHFYPQKGCVGGR